MAIPRNLVYVFLLAIIIAFGGMIYVVYTEKDLSYFITSPDTNDSVVVHPLFSFFEKVLPNPDYIPKINIEEITPKNFY